MVESNGAAPYVGSTRLGAEVPARDFDGVTERKQIEPTTNEKQLPLDDNDEEDEDMDALIEELESQDGHIDQEDEADNEPGGARPVPDELLQTDTRIGLTDAEVLLRRKKYGLNQMKEEKENMMLKFLSYFVGPIQFVMEVSDNRVSHSHLYVIWISTSSKNSGNMLIWIDFE